MKKKDWIYIVVFGVIVILAAVFFGDKLNEKEEVLIPVDGEEISEEEEQVEVPDEYFDLLREARDLIDDRDFDGALAMVNEALELHDGVQAYLTIAAVHDFTGDYNAKKDALYEVIYTHGSLESRYWRSYIDALVQLEIDSETIMAVYEDGIMRIRAISSAAGVSHTIDMYTSYAGYLGGNQMYAEAIDYLQRAAALDPARANIYNGEIEYYQGKL